MRLVLCICLLILFIIPLQAQGKTYDQSLSRLDVQVVHITRTDDDVLTLEIVATSDVCGELLIHQWYTEVTVDARSSETITIPAGDARRAASGQQYANLSLYILPHDSDCDGEHVISIVLPATIEMEFVPDYRDASFQDTVLLVNDFAAWFYIDDGDTTSTSMGQAIDIGETELTRWQKVDSVTEDLNSLGANPGTFVPWIEGYHPDGCEAPTHVNFILNPIEDDHYTADVFRLLPMDAVCPASLQPFVVTASGVIPQVEVILDLGETSHRIFADMGTTEPVLRQYPTVSDVDVQTTGDGLSVQFTVNLSENCDSPIIIDQAEIDGVSFVSLYYDVGEDMICTDAVSTLEEDIAIPSLPLVINGTVILE